MTLYDARGDYLVGGEIALATKRARQIPNDRATERPPVALEEAQKLILRDHPGAIPRSLSATYNCMGMVFAVRRTTIDTQELRMVLEDDEYRRLRARDEVVLGDLVVYKDGDGGVTHVGLVAEVRSDVASGSIDIMVMSQWGQDGEYIHHVDDVHPYLGSASEYWTDRQ